MTLLTELHSRFGAAQALAGDAAQPFERDWRGQFPGRAMAVLLPRSVAEVQAMVRFAAEHRVPIVTQGGNSGLVGGSTPDATGTELVLSLQRLKAVRRISAINQTLTAEAGCVLAQLQAACAEEGLLLPLSMASEGTCTLGGNLATNAGGTQVLRWGNARDLCLGLELVTAQGALWSDLDGLRKDHRGLNLRDVFIGSEGTLGVITAAVMKLAPLPRSRLAAWVTLDSLEAAAALLQAARQGLADALSGFEIMGETVQRLLQGLPLPVAPWAVLMELSASAEPAHVQLQLEQTLGRALAHSAGGNAVIAQSGAQFEAFWRLRESIPGEQTRAGGNLKHDICLPLDCIASFVAQMGAELTRRWPGVRPMVFGHMGDGNLHYNVAPACGEPIAPFTQNHGPAITRLVFETVRSFGGSFSAEHGIGRLRRDELAHHGDPVGLTLMRQIKDALDPAGLFNPGRLLETCRT
jgi:FAD/FMN-containing dehydrogenase